VSAVAEGRVLVVDDDPGVLDVVSFALQREGFDVEEARDGATALARGRDVRFDLVILDVMLPDLSGTQVCRTLRDESDVPIVMLTARDAESDRIVGLELGADDYVTKPFSTAELVSRVRAILRRRELDQQAAQGPVRRVGDLELDLGRQQLTIAGRRIHLTLSEFKMLSLLAAHAEQPVSRRALMEHLWGSDHVGDEHPCEVHVSNLRRKIEDDPQRPARLLTVRGRGYKLVAP
jgi:two-component system response regulator RegX3